MPIAQKQNTPVPDSFFGPSAESAAATINAGGNYTTTIPEPKPFLHSTDVGLQITQSGLLPGSSLRVEIQSTPTTIAQFVVPANGEVVQDIVLPEGIEPGAHELHIFGTTNFGIPVDYYEPLALAVSETDFDGDGILNDVDDCVTIVNSLVDVDEDGIDDACDSSLFAVPPPAAPVDEDTEDPADQPEEEPVEELIPEETQDLDKGQPSPETVAGDEEITAPQVLGESTSTDSNSTSQQGVLGAVVSLATTGNPAVLSIFVGVTCVSVGVGLLKRRNQD